MHKTSSGYYCVQQTQPLCLTVKSHSRVALQPVAVTRVGVINKQSINYMPMHYIRHMNTHIYNAVLLRHRCHGNRWAIGQWAEPEDTADVMDLHKPGHQHHKLLRNTICSRCFEVG